MIRLSIFMLDPVKAHELYVKEMTLLQNKLALAEEAVKLSKKEQKSMYKTMREKVRQMGCHISSAQIAANQNTGA